MATKFYNMEIIDLQSAGQILLEKGHCIVPIHADYFLSLRAGVPQEIPADFQHRGMLLGEELARVNPRYTLLSTGTHIVLVDKNDPMTRVEHALDGGHDFKVTIISDFEETEVIYY